MAPSLVPARKWYYLALRHLRMARRLQTAGFFDAAVFHTYHAFECLLSSLIAAKGFPVPPQGMVIPARGHPGPRGKVYYGPAGPLAEQGTHKLKILLFRQLREQEKAYSRTFALLSRSITVADRNDALYYDPVRDQLPEQRFSAEDASALLDRVSQFARELRIEIG